VRAKKVRGTIKIIFFEDGHCEVELEHGETIAVGRIEQAMSSVYRAVSQRKAQCRADAIRDRAATGASQ
jgi:hypothetical protein